MAEIHMSHIGTLSTLTPNWQTGFTYRFQVTVGFRAAPVTRYSLMPPQLFCDQPPYTGRTVPLTKLPSV
jgi:hypothetical protein